MSTETAMPIGGIWIRRGRGPRRASLCRREKWPSIRFVVCGSTAARKYTTAMGTRIIPCLPMIFMPMPTDAHKKKRAACHGCPFFLCMEVFSDNYNREKRNEKYSLFNERNFISCNKIILSSYNGEDLKEGCDRIYL